jgi:hypothetical protein
MARLRNRVDEMDRVVPVPACFNARLESVGRLRAQTPRIRIILVCSGCLSPRGSRALMRVGRTS